MSYYAEQFSNYAPLPLNDSNYPYGVDIQLKSTRGKTNWLRIKPETAKKIERLLIKEKG